MDLKPGSLILSRHLAELGLEPRRTRPARTPTLTRVRRGAYVATEEWRRSRPETQYRYLVLATLSAMRSDAFVSHESAAVLLGIPIIGRWPERVHVVEQVASGGRSSALVVKHGVKRLPGVVTVDGQGTTSIGRTALDLARTRSFVSALVSMDHVLASGAVTRDEVLAELELLRGSRGYRQARRVVECADARSESVGESLSRAQMYELRLPIPDLQRDFSDVDGPIGRCDYWWEHLRLIGEFDGKVKYQREGLAGEDPSAVVWREKRREDRLRSIVSGVLRWTWEEAWNRERLRTIMARAGVVPMR